MDSEVDINTLNLDGYDRKVGQEWISQDYVKR